MQQQQDREEHSFEVAAETLRAIRANEIDALVIGPDGSEKVFTLRGTDDAYRVFVEAIMEGAVTVDADGTVIYCNKHFSEMLQIPEPTAGMSLFDLIREEDHGEFRTLLWEGLSGTIRRRVSFVADDGTEVPASVIAMPSSDTTGRSVCLIITDLRDQEARLAAEAANKAKDRFLAMLSHELRTPLTPVLTAAAEMEVNPELPESVRRTASMIRRNVELEARLIDDLLDLTRVANQKLQLTLRVADLHDLLRHVVEICGVELKEKKLPLTCQFDAGESHVSGDAARLQQVFWNLLKNAIKFSPSQSPITIRTYNQHSQIVVEVSDRGVGIAPHMLEQIFEAFEQGNVGENPSGGLGLGLAISRRLIELHGGTIRAQSEGPGKGAVFTVTLQTQPRPAASPAAPSLDGDARIHVLLVEDHADTARMLSRLLEQAGYQVRAADCAAAALQLADEKPFDVLLSDLNLPDASGLELMRQIRQRFDRPGIALTGFNDQAVLDAARAAGFVAHVVKPVDFDQLDGLLRQVRTGSGGAA